MQSIFVGGKLLLSYAPALFLALEQKRYGSSWVGQPLS